MTPYEKLENRINEILGDETPLSFDRIFVSLNKFFALRENRIPLLAPDGTIYFLSKQDWWEDQYDMDEDMITLINKNPQLEDDVEEPYLFAIGTVAKSNLKLNPLLPLNSQDEVGNYTLSVLESILH